MELLTAMSGAMGSAMSIHWAVQVAASLTAGVLSLAAAVYAYTRLTCGVCSCTASLEGKTAVVTGANSGIGYYTALDFAKRKARVIVAGRNSEKIETAAHAIREKTGNPHVVARLLDVSLMKSVRAFVKEFLETEERLDILVNNAGISGSPSLDLARTEEGLELTMATNHLGHFLLTNLLLDEIKKFAPSRIINVSSLMHTFVKNINVNNLNASIDFNKRAIYGDTKLCNVLFTRELAQLLTGTGVSVYSLHPGAVATEIFRNVRWPWTWIIGTASMIGFKSSEEGALTTIHCAVAPGIEKHSGKYFSDCKVAKMNNLAEDETLVKAVWDASASLVSLK